ncbi:nucleoid-associated protein YejK [Idiomarina sp. OT37-5b]|uniref:nucleoid-associated protein YejK n=1 Tax=Idiomarina sp. OT37-5b TaxID=2100422 RepID=UPI000CFA3CD5|nr:nucleoid-associated protein YejK [Idiomarina sp. OT37-5b]AVJ55815.1 nucleoid-associated protein YejK [Idiomarina sp. OT37-5b]
MQLRIENSIIHQFYSHDDQVGLRLAPEALAEDEQLHELLEELTQVYTNKPAKGYASFITEQDDGERGPFPDVLKQWHTDQLQFVDFSQQAAKLLLEQLQNHNMLEAGFLLITRYQHLSTDYLLVAFLPVKEGVSINPNLAVNKSSQLDISKVQLAARINLTDWETEADSERYISFIKGRAGRKVSDFFLDFLGCTERLNAKSQTQTLIEAVNEYGKSAELEPQQRQSLNAVAYEYCDQQWKQGEDVRVKDLSEHFAQAQPSERSFEDFSREYTQQREAELPEEFPADKATLRKLVKFQGQGGGVSVGFDHTQLGERIQYDAATDTLTIHGTPPNLRDQLRRYFGIDS